MKSFTRRGYRIVDANTETKLVYTFFLIFILFGFITVAGYQFEIIGWGWRAIERHFLGDEVALNFPQSFLQLLELTHFHAFMMGLVYLTLIHIVLATRLPTKTKYLLSIGGFVATLLDLIMPWCIRYVSPAFIPAFIAGWIGEWVFYLSYIVIPILDMWIIPDESEEE